MIGAVILFTMLFTIGTTYFIFVNNANNMENRSLINRTNSIGTQAQDAVTITTSLGASDYVRFYLNNTGGQTLNVTSLLVLSSAGTVLECDGIALPASQGCINTAPVLPIIANPGSGAPRSGYAATNYVYASGTVTLKLITADGNVFTATYPNTGVSLASQALSSGAIGDLYLSFNSYSYYILTSSGCPSGTGYSTYCLQTNSPNYGGGFAISSALTSGKFAFSVTMTNLNQQQADIVLDQYTLMYLNNFYGNSHQNNIPWYITSVGSQSGQKIPIDNSYTPVVLYYDTPTTVYFISSNCVTAATGPNDASCSSFAPQSQTYSAGSVATVFILSNGWEMTHGSYTLSSLAYSQANYGQNTPYVSTLFY